MRSGLKYKISDICPPGVVQPVYPPENVLLLSLPEEKIVDHSGPPHPKPGHDPGHDGVQVVEGLDGPLRDLLAGQAPADCGEVSGQVGESV